jgi:hypothetical protein
LRAVNGTRRAIALAASVLALALWAVSAAQAQNVVFKFDYAEGPHDSCTVEQDNYIGEIAVNRIQLRAPSRRRSAGCRR